MLNYIWMGMLVLGFGLGIINGRLEEVTQALIDSSKAAVELCIGLLGIMCLWTGLMKIAEQSGMVEKISRLARPVMAVLFPAIPKNHPAIGSIMMNLVANMLGLGNAATPLGIKAMEELQKLNKKKDTATNEMSMFLVLNTSAIQLVPATIIAVRSAKGSKNPAEVIVTIWGASIFASIVGILSAKIFSKIWRNGSNLNKYNNYGRRKLWR